MKNTREFIRVFLTPFAIIILNCSLILTGLCYLCPLEQFDSEKREKMMNGLNVISVVLAGLCTMFVYSIIDDLNKKFFLKDVSPDPAYILREHKCQCDRCKLILITNVHKSSVHWLFVNMWIFFFVSDDILKQRKRIINTKNRDVLSNLKNCSCSNCIDERRSNGENRSVSISSPDPSVGVAVTATSMLQQK